jgi:hypothetical protein
MQSGLLEPGRQCDPIQRRASAKYDTLGALKAILDTKESDDSSSQATEYITATSLHSEGGHTGRSSSDDSFLSVRSKASLREYDPRSLDDHGGEDSGSQQGTRQSSQCRVSPTFLYH